MASRSHPPWPRAIARVVRPTYTRAMRTLKSGRKKVIQFTTPSGVNAVVASSLSQAIVSKLADKLQRKLKRAGHSIDDIVPAAKRTARS